MRVRAGRVVTAKRSGVVLAALCMAASWPSRWTAPPLWMDLTVAIQGAAATACGVAETACGACISAPCVT